jgi:hypothetical protein
MTYTFKLARRLARLRHGAAVLLPILAAACAAGEPTPPDTTSTDTGDNGQVALNPREVTLEGSQGVLFRAFESLIPGSGQVTSIEWTTTGGSIQSNGSYAPSSAGAFKVVGRRRGNPHNTPDTSVVVVVPPQPTVVAVELTPSTATVGGGLQQQFTAVGRQSDGIEVLIGVTWTATGGTIDAGGLYTAGFTAGTYRVIATHVTTNLADTAVVTVPPATLTSITLTPGSVSLGAGQGQQFSVSGKLSDGTSTATVPVAYTATGGSISVSGYYTAGSSGGTFRVIATAQGGKADTSSVSITSSAPPPPPPGLWLDEDFSRYTSMDHYKSNPFGWNVTPPSWAHQEQFSWGPGYNGSKQSLQYNWPGVDRATTCGSDYAITSIYKAPQVPEVWIEFVHQYATTFNTNTTNVGGTCNFGEYKMLLLWRSVGDRFDLVNGHGGYSWWSGNPQSPYAVSTSTTPCSQAGSGGNCEVTALGKGTSAMRWDGQWHVYRVHIKFNSAQGVKDGVFQIWVDGQLVKDLRNIDMTNYSNGLWTNRLQSIMLGSNSNSGTSQPTYTRWGRVRVWTGSPGW